MDQYKSIIFDWDGTLVDTCGLFLDAHNHVRTYMGQELWTMENFLGRASKSAREYYPEIYGDRADEAQTVLYDYVRKHHLDYLNPMDGALDLIKYLYSQNFFLGVVSNKKHDVLCKEIEQFGWQTYFDVVIGAGYAAADKPSPIPLLLAIDQIGKGLTQKDVLYVGDTETDLLCAQNAKLPIAFIQSNRPRPDLIEKYNPAYIHDDLLSFIGQFCKKNQEIA